MKTNPVIAVRFFDTLITDDNGSWTLKPKSKKVLVNLRKRKNAKIVLWIEEFHGKVCAHSGYKGKSADAILAFLKTKKIPVDLINHVSIANNSEYDHLICSKAGFDGDWLKLGIEFGVVDDTNKIYVVECSNGKFFLGKTDHFNQTFDKMRNGGGTPTVKKHGFKEVIWKSKDLNQNAADELLLFIKNSFDDSDFESLKKGVLRISRRKFGDKFGYIKNVKRIPKKRKKRSKA